MVKRDALSKEKLTQSPSQLCLYTMPITEYLSDGNQLCRQREKWRRGKDGEEYGRSWVSMSGAQFVTYRMLYLRVTSLCLSFRGIVGLKILYSLLICIGLFVKAVI